jgi:hypothetical protein
VSAEPALLSIGGRRSPARACVYSYNIVTTRTITCWTYYMMISISTNINHFYSISSDF